MNSILSTKFLSKPLSDISTSATAFTYAVQTPGPSQAMFQSDGIYDPVANTTNWNTPYLSNLKVGSLSAITVNTGGLIVSDYIRAQAGGSTPAVSGSSMTGAGAVINSTGTFAYGNTAKNLSFDGSTLSMNGDLVVTGNIVNSAVTRVATVYANSTVTGSGLGVYYTLASLNITTSVDCFIYALFTAKQNYGGIFNPTSVTALSIDGNTTSVGGQSVQTNIAVSLSVYLAAGVHTVNVVWDASSPLITVTDRSLYVQGSQR
jgi:hypothetical protein